MHNIMSSFLSHGVEVFSCNTLDLREYVCINVTALQDSNFFFQSKANVIDVDYVIIRYYVRLCTIIFWHMMLMK